jgi:hypothetical protein
MLTVRCFQIRLSVSSVSYSSTRAGKRFVKSSMKSSSEPLRASLRRSSSLASRFADAWYFGIELGKSSRTPPGR